MKYLIYVLLVSLTLTAGCGVGKKAPVELDNYGEGSSSMEVPVLEEEKELQQNQPITVQTESADYSLRIDEVIFTEQRNEFEADYEAVVLVTYTYENASEEPLLIDDLRFQLISSDETTIHMPYYLSDMKYAEIANQGEAVTAQVAFGIQDQSESFKLVYTDTSSGSESLWVHDIVLQKY